MNYFKVLWSSISSRSKSFKFWFSSLYVCALSCVWLFATPWTVAHQASLSVEFSRQEYWSGLLFPPPGHLPNPGVEPTSLACPALAGGFFTTEPRWSFCYFTSLSSSSSPPSSHLLIWTCLLPVPVPTCPLMLCDLGQLASPVWAPCMHLYSERAGLDQQAQTQVQGSKTKNKTDAVCLHIVNKYLKIIQPFPINTYLLWFFAETHYPLSLAFTFQPRGEMKGWEVGHSSLGSKNKTTQVWWRRSSDGSLCAGRQ